ncbi:MAG: hypothetical protein ACYDGZ_14680 [Desulfosporosinus fructosivorans]
MKQMLKLKGKIWGFRKTEVEEYINKLKTSQEAELEELSKKIEECQRETEILRHEFSTLTDTNASFPATILLELAVKRVARISEYIDLDVDMEVLAIDKITRQKAQALENIITEIDKDIEKETEIIAIELKNIVEIARGQERRKNINIGVLKDNELEQTYLGKGYWGEEPTSRVKELIIQMVSSASTLESTTKTDVNSITSDMMTDSREIEEEEEIVYSELESAQQGSPEKGNPSMQEVAATFDSETKVDIFQQLEDSKTTLEAIPNEQLHSGVHEDISAVRDMNIIGRVAGEDITDSSGQIIIHKDEPITSNIMQRAKDEGRLSDLIIHMILPREEE